MISISWLKQINSASVNNDVAIVILFEYDAYIKLFNG